MKIVARNLFLKSFLNNKIYLYIFFKIYLNFIYSETRHRFIKDKYEKHKFVQRDTKNDKFYNFNFIEFAKSNTREKTFELILKFFAQNGNLMTPNETDVSFKVAIF